MNNWSFVFIQWFKRDLIGRYRGSILGLSWPILQPLSQIIVFTLIFHGFMQQRWPSSQLNTSAAMHSSLIGSDWIYGINVLVGLCIFNFISEIFGRAPVAIFSQPNLVTKVKFPLLILPVVTTMSALVHIFAGFIILCLMSFILGVGSLHLLWFPIWLIPVILYGLAAATVLSCIGVYIRDLVQLMPAITSLLMFLTPIFYPLSAVPISLKPIFELNPLTWAAESLRGIILLSQPLDLALWMLHMLVASFLLLISFVLFNRIKSGFSDVL